MLIHIAAQRPPRKKTACLVLCSHDSEEYSLALANALDGGWSHVYVNVTSAFGPQGFVTCYHAILHRWDDA